MIEVNCSLDVFANCNGTGKTCYHDELECDGARQEHVCSCRKRPVIESPVDKAIKFLNAIGIPCERRSGVNGFMPGIRIESGMLLIDSAVVYIGDILHEAGHLAILPSRFRQFASGNIGETILHMMEGVDFSNPDAPEARAAIQSGDQEATAWAWAAGKALGFLGEDIIRDSDYEGTGSEVRACLSCGGYVGVHGLAHAGFCVTRPRLVEVWKLPVYPTLAHWTQP